MSVCKAHYLVLHYSLGLFSLVMLELTVKHCLFSHTPSSLAPKGGVRPNSSESPYIT